MTTTISKDSKNFTFVNIFNLQPDHQPEVADRLKEFTASFISRQPGFVSASLLKSHDGTRLIMYSQWRGQEDYEAMRATPESKAFVEKVMPVLASFQPGTFEVVETFERQE